jgi:hypothetical protein
MARSPIVLVSAGLFASILGLVLHGSSRAIPVGPVGGYFSEQLFRGVVLLGAPFCAVFGSFLGGIGFQWRTAGFGIVGKSRLKLWFGQAIVIAGSAFALICSCLALGGGLDSLAGMLGVGSVLVVLEEGLVAGLFAFLWGTLGLAAAVAIRSFSGGLGCVCGIFVAATVGEAGMPLWIRSALPLWNAKAVLYGINPELRGVLAIVGVDGGAWMGGWGVLGLWTCGALALSFVLSIRREF